VRSTVFLGVGVVAKLEDGFAERVFSEGVF
jgi:hypothetical protein